MLTPLLVLLKIITLVLCLEAVRLLSSIKFLTWAQMRQMRLYPRLARGKKGVPQHSPLQNLEICLGKKKEQANVTETEALKMRHQWAAI